MKITTRFAYIIESDGFRDAIYSDSPMEPRAIEAEASRRIARVEAIKAEAPPEMSEEERIDLDLEEVNARRVSLLERKAEILMEKGRG